MKCGQSQLRAIGAPASNACPCKTVGAVLHLIGYTICTYSLVRTHIFSTIISYYKQKDITIPLAESYVFFGNSGDYRYLKHYSKEARSKIIHYSYYFHIALQLFFLGFPDNHYGIPCAAIAEQFQHISMLLLYPPDH